MGRRPSSGDGQVVDGVEMVTDILGPTIYTVVHSVYLALDNINSTVAHLSDIGTIIANLGVIETAAAVSLTITADKQIVIDSTAAAQTSAAAAHQSELNAAGSATTSTNNAASTLADKNATNANAAAAAQSATNAATSETNAATSATTATTKAGEASASATAAAGSATGAATSATNANNSKVAAATSETNAHTSEVNAAQSASDAAASAAEAQAIAGGDYVTTSSKGVANGVATLDSGGRVPSAQLPSYVDDVLEYANLAAFPGTGEAGKIYIADDTNFEYRWSGTQYIKLVASPGTTDALVEGTVNLYFTNARAQSALSGSNGATYVGYIEAKTGAVARTVASKLNETVSVTDFGAIGDGTHDDTTAIQAALNSGAGFIYVLPGTYKVTSTLNFAFAGQTLIGGGVSSTSIVFYTGANTGLVCNGYNTCSILGIKLKGSGNTAGEILLVQNCSAFIGKQIRVETGFNGVTVLSTNNVTFEDFVFADHTGSYAIRFAGTVTVRCDVLKLHGGEISHASNNTITSILWESYAHSLTLQDIRVINGGKGLKVWDSSGAGTALSIPSFLQASIVEFDFPNGEAIRVDDLRDAWITNLYNNQSVGTNGVHFGANAWSIRATNLRVASASQHGIYVAGKFIQISNSYCYLNGQSASNTYDGIYVDSTAVDVIVNNSISGSDPNLGAAQQRYGLNVHTSAVRINYFGNDFNGNVSGHANGGTDLAYRVGSSNRHSFYNANGLHLSIGGSTASVVNNVRFAGSATGSSPTLLAEGNDTNIGLTITPKGSGSLTVNTNTGGFNISAAAGTQAVQFFQRANSSRFAVSVDNATESGSNVGSNFNISRYSDAGAWVDNPLSITRSTGDVAIAHSLTVNGGRTVVGMGSDGGMEIGSYIDFHNPTNDGLDYKARVSVGSGGGITMTAAALTVTGPLFYVNNGNLVVQHDGTDGYIRADVGTLNLGASGVNTLKLLNTGQTIQQVSTGYFTNNGSGGAFNVGYYNAKTGGGQVGYHMYNGGGVNEWVLYQPAHATGDDLRFAVGVAGTLTDKYRFDNAGGLSLIGTNAGVILNDRTAGSSAFWVTYNASDAFRVWNNTAGSDRFNIDNSGNGWFAGNITSASDRRLKKHISYKMTFGLKDVLQLKPVTYRWKGQPNSKPKDIGFIAQDVEEIFPELVRTDEQGMKSVDYQKTTVVLLQALKELVARVEKLENGTR